MHDKAQNVSRSRNTGPQSCTVKWFPGKALCTTSKVERLQGWWHLSPGSGISVPPGVPRRCICLRLKYHMRWGSPRGPPYCIQTQPVRLSAASSLTRMIWRLLLAVTVFSRETKLGKGGGQKGKKKSRREKSYAWNSNKDGRQGCQRPGNTCDFCSCHETRFRYYQDRQLEEREP